MPRAPAALSRLLTRFDAVSDHFVGPRDNWQGMTGPALVRLLGAVTGRPVSILYGDVAKPGLNDASLQCMVQEHQAQGSVLALLHFHGGGPHYVCVTRMVPGDRVEFISTVPGTSGAMTWQEFRTELWAAYVH